MQIVTAHIVSKKQTDTLLIIVCGFLLLLSLSSSGQKYYAGFNAGYNLPFASQNIASKIDNELLQSSSLVVKGSLGQGINASGYGGLHLNKNLSFELGASYLYGSRFDGYFNKDTSFIQSSNISAYMVRLLPALRISGGENKLKYFIRFGAVLRLASTINVQNNYTDLTQNITSSTNWKYRHGLSIGVCASLGIAYEIKPNTFFSVELENMNQSWAPAEARVSEHTVNGVDQSTTLNESQKRTVFVKEFSIENNYFSTWEPRTQLKQYFPFSSIGLKVGLHFTFGTKTNSQQQPDEK